MTDEMRVCLLRVKAFSQERQSFVSSALSPQVSVKLHCLPSGSTLSFATLGALTLALQRMSEFHVIAVGRILCASSTPAKGAS